MGQRIPNAYRHPFDPGMDPNDKRAANKFFGIKEQVGPPRPTADQMFGGDSYADGTLKDPMEQGEHGGASPHASSGGDREEPHGMMDDAWDKFKAHLGVAKTIAGKLPPKKKFPEGTPPKNHQKILEAAAIANTPDDDDALKDLSKLIDKYEKGEKKMDLSPLIALTDSWTGSHLMQGYDKPLGDDEREKIVLGLKSKLAMQKDKISQDRQDLIMKMADSKERRELQAQEKENDRENRRVIAGIAAAGRQDRADNADANKEIGNKAKALKDNKPALKAIAKKKQPPAGPDDRSYELHIGAVNDEVYEFGKHLEEEGGAKKGQGYQMALEFYLQNASGPDGAK